MLHVQATTLHIDVLKVLYASFKCPDHVVEKSLKCP